LFGAGSRLDQLVRWLAGGECLIVFDECHKAKNLLDAAGYSSQTGLAVEALQHQLPDARVLYSSATGASEPDNLRYMVRLGSFGYTHIGQMIDVLKSSGLGALEMFSMGLKASGTYLSRTLSYKGAEFRLEQVDMDPVFRVMYDRSCSLWALIYNVMRQVKPKSKGKGSRDKRASLFWGAHQRFYRQMLIASKVRRCAELADEALTEGMCVVIGMQSTGEANLNSAREQGGGGGAAGGRRRRRGAADAEVAGEEEEMEDFVSAPKMVLQNFISQWLFPAVVDEEETTPLRMRKLQVEVYRICKAWQQLPSAVEEADRLAREAKRQANVDARAAARAAAAAGSSPPSAAAAAAAGGAGPSRAAAAAGSAGAGGALSPYGRAAAASRQPQRTPAPAPRVVLELDDDDDFVEIVEVRPAGTPAPATTPAQRRGQQQDQKGVVVKTPVAPAAGESLGGGAAAAVAAVAAAALSVDEARDDDDDEDDVVVAGERSLDEILEDKRRRALLTGDLIDLAACGEEEDAETRQALAEIKQETCDAEEKKRRGAQRAQLEAELAKARKRVAVEQREVQRLRSQLASGGAGTSAQTGADACRKRKAAQLDANGDVIMSERNDEEQPGAAAKAARRNSSETAAAAAAAAATPTPSVVQGVEHISLLSSDDEADDGASVPEPQERHAAAAAAAGAGAGPSGSGVGPESVALRAARIRLKTAEAAVASLQRKIEQLGNGSGRSPPGQAKQCGGSGAGAVAGRAGGEGRRSARVAAAAAAPRRGSDSSGGEVLGSSEEEDGAAGDDSDDESWCEEEAEEVDPAAAGPSTSGRRRNSTAAAGARAGAGAVAGSSANLALYRHTVKHKPLRRQNNDNSDEDGEDLDGLVDENNNDDGDDDDLMRSVLGGASNQRRGPDRRASSGSDGEEDGTAAVESFLPPELQACRTMLLRLLDAQELPLNPLDQLTELLGGEGAVAEMTGRRMLLVRNEEGKVVCKQRREDEAQKMVNMAEKEDFMSGRKLVAIISDAASTGISLQADRRAANQRRRFHITLELPWSADKAIQQFGRSHRSNQASAPIYCLLVTQCGGEYRFAGAVAKRLTSLGALLRGDRRALGASSDLKPFDVDNKYGLMAVNRLLECVAAGMHNVAGARVPELPEEQLSAAAAASRPGSGLRVEAFMSVMQLALKSMGLLEDAGGHYVVAGTKPEGGKKKSTDVPKFLNRLLGLPLGSQQLLFTYFTNIMDSLIKQARSAGTYDEAILNLAASRVTLAHEETIHTDQETQASTQYLEVDVDDGMSWGEATQALQAALADMRAEQAPQQLVDKVGFYVAKRNKNVGGMGHPLVLLATAMRRATVGARAQQEFRIQRPNQIKGHLFGQGELQDKYEKVDTSTARKHWVFWHNYLQHGCLHGQNCERRRRLGACNYGSRVYRLFLVSGAVLPLLRQLFDTVQGSSSSAGRSTNTKAMPRVARVALGDGRVLVGMSLLEQDAQSFVARVTT
ncbi:hypothetical protein Agub_g10015, partial [Astrephomene gubernaculifera]